MNVVVVCFGFEPSNLKKQPWRYVHELIADLPSKGFELTVVTDVHRTDTAGIRVKPVKKILNVGGPTREVVNSIKQENPHLVITLVGPSSFFRKKTIASVTEAPTIGIVGGPLNSPAEVLDPGLTDVYNYREYLLPSLVGSLVPKWLIQKHASEYDYLITLTSENKSRIQDIGVSSQILTIPPGIDEFDLELPDSQDIQDVRQGLDLEDVTTILYFTSPLTIRGTDTLIKSFARVRQNYPCNLVVLSRQDSGGLTEEETLLRKLAAQHSVTDSFEIIPRDLSPEGVKTHLAAADIIALPFKIVVASVPISIMEAMAVGRPVITTNVVGIPDIISEQQVVKSNDISSLSATLESLISDKDLRTTIGSQNRDRMQHHQRWDDARSQFLDVVEECV